MMPTYSLKPSGKYVDLNDFDKDDIDIEDIIICLANINRWAGGIKWSVAAHTILCMQLIGSPGWEQWLLDHAPMGEGGMCVRCNMQTVMLLHDVHETYIGDIIRPVAVMLDSDRLKLMKRHYDAKIYRFFNMEPPVMPLALAGIQYLDDLALRIEKHYFKTKMGHNILTVDMDHLRAALGVTLESYEALEVLNDKFTALFEQAIRQIKNSYQPVPQFTYELRD